MNDYVSFAEYESSEFSSFEQATSHEEVTLKSAAELSTIEVPERQWAWQDWLPLGTASLLGGPPGAGKSLLAQTICMAASKGLVLYGADTRLMSTLYLTCEDDEG